MKEMVGGCCVCSDDRGWPENPLVYCDGQSCTVAVHQACYGIVTVPTGPWYCRKCESQERSVKVKCELCPSKYGALKRTDNSGWAHVVCALYIPEVRFGNVTTMEPIQLQLIPQERFSKVCYICKENGKPANASIGACMQCNKSGCKQQFHVTCAQSLGLLCEEAGNYLDNVKYCGYCQYHYSKLRKGGNVKTIPPYKPVSTENHQSDSSSEKETDLSNKSAALSGLGKHKTTSNTKSSTSKVSSSTSSASSSTSNVKSTPTYQKQSSVAKISEKSGKTNTSVKSAKSTDENIIVDSDKTDKKELETDKEVKDSSKGKKRKANSRTPTPNIISEASAVVTESAPVTVSSAQKKDSPVRNELTEKTKKAKTDPPAQHVINTVTPQTTASNTAIAYTSASTTTASTAEPALITITTASPVIQPTPSQAINSVVVSVPLHNTSLSPHNNNQQVINTPIPVATQVQPEERKIISTEVKQAEILRVLTSSYPIEAALPQEIHSTLPVANLPEETNMITSEMSGGGLKITFEKQTGPGPVPMELEEMIPTPTPELPAKRSRSQSAEKSEKSTRSKKKNSNGMMNTLANVVGTSKRSSRSQHNTPPPQQSTSFVNLPQQSQIKDSPPSSPSSESMGAAPNLGRKKGRKSAPASVASLSNSSSNTSKDSKQDIKLFQNGINAPHMLGNQLNLNSNMAQKMSDHLNSELEAHSIFNTTEGTTSLVGPQLHHRVIASVRSNSAGGSSTASGGSGLSSMLGGGGGAIPQTLDQLLERQWEQGSQFLMEQAQHFDIASLLSCLHQLRAENLRLEEHVSSLLQRRDHLLAVNARLAIPLTGPPVAPQSTHPHTVNNIHPSVAVSHAEAPRPRHSGSYSSHGPSSSQHSTGSLENGISPEQNYPHSHRSPVVTQPQPSPNIRQSSGSYSSSGTMRPSTESSGRSAPRPHGYSLYQGPSNTQQVVIRRDSDQHQNPTKPS